jgi:hypothetical protein
MMIVHHFPTRSRFIGSIVFFIFCLLPCVLVLPATAADIDMEGYFGDTFTLHGYSYASDSVYLFMTGPGLPQNGVTLTDTSLRADQGHFTVVDVDENQEWTYIWKTSRIDSEIDPGTYTVYVTNTPADLSHLGGESSYRTYSFYLKDSGVSKISINAQHVYTLSPEDPSSTLLPVPSVDLTSATPVPTTPSPVPASTPQQPVPTTRAGTGPWTAVITLICCVVLVSVLKPRH